MISSLHHSALSTFHFRQEILEIGTAAPTKLKEPDNTKRRRALRRVDRELSKGNFKTALSLVKQLQGRPGGLRGFGAAKQVSRRISSLDKLNLSGLDISSLQSFVDSILSSIENSIQFQLSDEGPSLQLDSLMLSESYNPCCKDHLMCVQHEAGHFLVGYLLGVLPKGYAVSSPEEMNMKHDKFVGGSVQFLGFEFLKEVGAIETTERAVSKAKRLKRASKGKLSTTMLNRFSCVILGGLVAEHLVFGYSEGLHSDVEKLDRVLKWLEFTETDADAHLRWAALNTVLILGRHHEARSRLAESMALGRSIGFCIDTIENSLHDKEI